MALISASIVGRALQRAALLLLLLCVAAVAASPRLAPGAGSRPNIVFILADDLGWGDLGCYGQREIQTPHIDRLAREGIRFTRVYAGSTVCAPSRCVLMTGRHTGHARVRGNLRVPLEPGDLTVAELLQRGGYRTGLSGKWGLGEEGSVGMPTRKGFEHFFGYLSQLHAHNYYPSFLIRGEERVALDNQLGKSDPSGAGVAVVRKQYSADLILDDALDFIRRDDGRPFFLYLALTLPHANNEAGKEGLEVPELGPYANADWPENKKRFAAMVTRMDSAVGRVMELLRIRGVDTQTAVFFSSDNGPHREGGNDPTWFRSSGPFRGIKRDLFEGGIRVPMIVRWPGVIPKNHVSDQPWWFADLLPTCADLAGLRAPRGLDGRSVVSVLRGGDQNWGQRGFYWEFHEGGFKQAAMLGDWKAIRGGLQGPLELYNLRADPSETQDVAARHPREAARLRSFLNGARTDSEHWPVKPAASANTP